ncbi:MAG: zinc-binding dehydrogenase [Proteobacteria bacterium]|nr:zinc-binding dehydrogenase [Pseudomonadota bacterium]
MRAVFLTSNGATDKITLGDLPKPVPKQDEVLIEIKFSALNHLDIWVREGWPGLKLAFPHIMGGDASGIVSQLGEGVTAFGIGDEVIIYPGVSCEKCSHCLMGWESLCSKYAILGEQVSGTEAEWVAVPVGNVFKKPKHLSFQEAASVPLVFTTAWQMLVVRAKIREGDRVLIHGAGSGVSTAAIQIAKLFGAEVAITSSRKEKLEKAKSLGADILILSTEKDFAKEVKRHWLGGADIIVDHVGQVFWEQNIRCLRSGGTLVTCGATSGGAGITDLKHLFFRQLSLLGSTMGNKKDFEKILGHIENKKLKAVVDREFLLSEVAEAHRYIEDGKQFGKVVIKVSQ